MSNDVKFWVARFCMAGVVLLGSSLLAVVGGQAMSGEGINIWLVIFFFSLIIGSIPLGFWYEQCKSRRWSSSNGIENARAEVEVLSAYGASLRNKNTLVPQDSSQYAEPTQGWHYPESDNSPAEGTVIRKN